MDKKIKKDKISFPFNNHLFNQADIDIINEKIEDNISSLFDEENYIYIDDKLLDLNVRLNSLLDSTQIKIFNEYIRLSLEANTYKNCLAYYLGIQYGMNINDFE